MKKTTIIVLSICLAFFVFIATGFLLHFTDEIWLSDSEILFSEVIPNGQDKAIGFVTSGGVTADFISGGIYSKSRS